MGTFYLLYVYKWRRDFKGKIIKNFTKMRDSGGGVSKMVEKFNTYYLNGPYVVVIESVMGHIKKLWTLFDLVLTLKWKLDYIRKFRT